MNSQFLFRKNVDKCVLNHGITIPVKFHQLMYDKFGEIERGTSKNLSVYIDNESFEIMLLRVDFKKENREVIQIRYTSPNSALPIYLRRKFPNTNTFVEEADKRKKMGMTVPKLSESEKEYIDIELVEDGFNFICYPNDSAIPMPPKEPEPPKPPRIPVTPINSPKHSIDSTNKINALIAKGKIRGFVKENEVLAVLPEGTSEEKIEEIFKTIIANNIELRWEE